MIWSEKKKCRPGEQSHGLGVQRDITKKKMAYFGRFGVEEPRHSEAISDEKCYLCRSACLVRSFTSVFVLGLAHESASVGLRE